MPKKNRPSKPVKRLSSPPAKVVPSSAFLTRSSTYLDSLLPNSPLLGLISIMVLIVCNLIPWIFIYRAAPAMQQLKLQLPHVLLSYPLLLFFLPLYLYAFIWLLVQSRRSLLWLLVTIIDIAFTIFIFFLYRHFSYQEQTNYPNYVLSQNFIYLPFLLGYLAARLIQTFTLCLILAPNYRQLYLLIRQKIIRLFGRVPPIPYLWIIRLLALFHIFRTLPRLISTF